MWQGWKSAIGHAKTTAADGSLPYAAVCYFHRQAGRPDNGNYLDSGEVSAMKAVDSL